MKAKHGIVVSDLHCGHRVGLTHPIYQIKYPPETPSKFHKLAEISRTLWDHFYNDLNSLPKLDFAFINGDMIEGKGKKSGGTELITSDMNVQCDMAACALHEIKIRMNKNGKMIGTYGTPYHTEVEGDEWENKIAERVGFDKIGAHEWVEINGKIFDFRHHVGSSTVPYGRHTAVAKEVAWNWISSLRDEQPKADVLIRSHVHYFAYSGTADYLAMTTPALQGMGSKFGRKRCSGVVDFGFIYFIVHANGEIEWHPFITKIRQQKPEVIKI